MSTVVECPAPEGSLLDRHRRDGAYVDCYMAELPGPVTHAQYVEAFYTTTLFKLERFILGIAAMPSTDAEARELAQGGRQAFAAWRVEDRRDNEILLAAGRTRSWLMVATAAPQDSAATRLYFGSAAVPVMDGRSGRPRLGAGFAVLLGFHKLYSRALLQAARSKLGAQASS